METSNFTKIIRSMGLAFLLTFFISGCLGFGDSKAPESPSYSSPPETSGSGEKPKKTTAVYYDFEDILIPLELKVNKDRTVVVSTPGFRSGILALKGMVDSNSLFNFFSSNMLKDNWSVVSKIKSPGTMIMVYQKTSRCAVITIRETRLNTYVEIGVAPTINDAAGGFEQMDLTN